MNGLNKVVVKKDSIQVAVSVHATIPEFDKPVNTVFFEDRYEGKQHVIFVAYLDETPIGYMISYDKHEDNSIYCWMAGVNPKFRRKGSLQLMMNKLETWCKENDIHTIHIKTRNSRREMLNYLVKNGFLLTEVLTEPDIKENRILLQKPINNA